MMRRIWSKCKSWAGTDGSRIKVPTILQMEATECGAASLAMILAHHGLWVPLEKLRQECGVDRDGSKASNVVRAARGRCCEAHGYRLSADDLRDTDQLAFPVIIHWEFNHFVVLEGIRGGYAYLNDPAMGRRRVPWEEFRTSYTGVTLTVEPGAGFQPAGQRFNVYKAVAMKLKDDKWAVFFVLLLGFCMLIPNLANPIFQQVFLDDILTRKHPDWGESFFLAMILSFLVCGIMNWLRAVILTQWQRKITLADSSSFFWHVLRLPMQFFQQRYAAEVASRIGFNESIAGVLSGSAATCILDLIIALFYLGLLLQYSVVLTGIGVLFSAVDLIFFLATKRHMTDLAMRIQQDAGKEYGTAMNGLTMIETIKANGNEADFFSKWAGHQTKVLSGQMELAVWNMNVGLLPMLLGGLNGALIMTLGGFSIMEGAMTAGMFMAFQNLMGSFQSPINSLIDLGSTLQNTEMQMQRINDVRLYEVDPLNYPAQAAAGHQGRRLSGRLDIEHMDFGYSPLDPPLLQDFELHLRPGRWAALVGSSGSGKSTLAKVVTGLYEEWAGEVRFDGVRRRELPRTVITNSLSAVGQDTFQLTGTIRQNITLFDDSIPQEDVIQAARDACIHEDIIRLEGGYAHEVAEGGLNFSGGQRQRLEIARALVKNPSLLVLDEATSALDPITEQQIIINLRRRGCACVVVAHRLSTIRDCDEILVLEKGRVVERGTHQQMMQHDGPYHQLIRENDAAEASEVDS